MMIKKKNDNNYDNIVLKESEMQWFRWWYRRYWWSWERWWEGGRWWGWYDNKKDEEKKNDKTNIQKKIKINILKLE